jgi:hypothetical protein
MNAAVMLVTTLVHLRDARLSRPELNSTPLERPSVFLQRALLALRFVP